MSAPPTRTSRSCGGNGVSRASTSAATRGFSKLDQGLAGYGYLLARETGPIHAYGYVRPATRGRGLGAEILRQIEARAKERGGDRLTNYALGSDPGADRLLRAHGYRPVRHYFHMGIDVADASFAAPLPGRTRGSDVPARPGRPGCPRGDRRGIRGSGATSRRDSTAGAGGTGNDPDSTPRYGSSRSTQARSPASPSAAQPATAAAASTRWGSSSELETTRSRAGAPAPLVQAPPHERRDPRRPQRGQRESDGRDAALRARRHARPVSLRPLRKGTLIVPCH